MIRLVVALVVVVNVVIALLLVGGESKISREGGLAELPPDSGSQLILLSEIDASERTPVNQSPPAQALIDIEEPREEIPEEEAPMCMVAGPFAAESSARELADRVGALGVSVDFLTETTETPGSIMVYTGPFASAQLAQRELRVLQSSGVDSFVVANGELANAISLGVFRTSENAVVQQDRLETLGYETRTYQYMVENDQYFISFGGQALSAITSDYWTDIASEYRDITIEQKACNEVASSGNFH